jgi:serine/threonine protein kinase
MSITGSLLAFGVRYVFDVSAERFLEVVEKHLTDHSQALPKALAKANDRAWQAVGLALAGDGWFDRIKDVFRDGDLKGVRDQIKQFLHDTPTGIEHARPNIRSKATEEWHRLRRAQRLSVGSMAPAALARRAAALERYGNVAQLTAAAHRAVADTAAALKEEAPHLAALLTTAPPNGTPLLAAAFAFFFRREVETNTELAHGLTFDFLRQIGDRQERGLMQLEASVGTHAGRVLDRLDGLFDALGNWFASTDAKLDDINAKLDQMVKLRDVPTSTSEPLKVTVTNKSELELLQTLRDRLRALPAELVAAADWSKLGDTLAAAGLFEEASEAHQTAVGAAHADADRSAEAENEYKRFRDACETGDRVAAMSAFHRAVELDPERFRPFDLHRYKPLAVLGVGGFGTVFLADDLYVRVGKDKQPQKVAIKAVHDSQWDTILERDLAETFDEADTLSTLNHSGIVKTVNRGFGDPVRRKRPYMVLEYFGGVTLDAWLKVKGPLPVRDVLVIAQQIAEAVHQAHQLGIYHRDLKPANVMINFDEKTQCWQVKVIDFGLAVKLHVARTSMGVPSGRRAALDRSLAGTLRYAPPEQRNELDADVGPYSDVYAFGKTCFDLLFGTTEPKAMHWRKLPEEYRDRVQELLERATVDHLKPIDDLEPRFPDFEPVLQALAGLLVQGRVVGPTPAELQEVATKAPPPAQTPDVQPTVRVPVESAASLPPPDRGKVSEDEKAKPGQTIAVRIPLAIPQHQPGELMLVMIPVPKPERPPGTLGTLKWKPVTVRANPNK